MWRANACCRTTFPVPVFLNRLDAPLCVFSLGMTVFSGNLDSSTKAGAGRVRRPVTMGPVMPLNGDTLGCFALVSYIPEPLAGFIDRLRIELIPNAKPRAHVTILPPRPYCGEIKKAIETIQQEARELAPFTVELGDVEIFPQSHVVYLSIRAGAAARPATAGRAMADNRVRARWGRARRRERCRRWAMARCSATRSTTRRRTRASG